MDIITNRQQEIIDAAGKILTKSGVSGLTIKNLAKEMQFSESAIYRHFESKEAIIIAMLEYLAKNIEERLQPIVDSDQSSEEKFIAIFKNQFSFFSKHPHFVVAVFSDGLLEESEKINKVVLNIMQTKIKYLLPIILKGQKKGTFTNVLTAEELLHITMGAFRLQMLKWRIENFQFDITKTGNKMIKSVLKLIKV